MSNRLKKRGLVAVDLFCGAGGLTRGLIDAGINVVKGYDFESKLRETYEKNNKGVHFYHKDIAKLTGKELLDGIDIKNNFFMLVGCAPCQPFSEINNKQLKRDKRKILMLEFARLIKETKPDFIFAENVPGLKIGKGKWIFKKFENILKKEGYFFESNIINAKNYGVPQNRTRLIILASRYGPIQFPIGEYGQKKKFITVRQAISKYPTIKAGKKHAIIKNHETRNLDKINMIRMKYIKKNGGSRFDLPSRLELECHRNHRGHNDVYGRMKWDDVAPTLTCKCTSISNGRFGHPTQNRGISVREAAALQTFRDHYIFYGDITFNTLMVGNAVPPLLAKRIGGVFANFTGEN